ncbi:hypothetical protein BGX26_005283, partial [Mortierella sp. AD094]
VVLRRDTVFVPAHSNVAIRLKADNPGVWFLHCHIEWHLQAGLAVAVIEASEVMQQILEIDPSHFQQCKEQGIQYQGNAAGNQGLNLTGASFGANVVP